MACAADVVVTIPDVDTVVPIVVEPLDVNVTVDVVRVPV